ncbi:Regulation of enolase 1 [Hyphodiscus hymeniophilus]|uniref:Regulation of enolase 1 n=1 Tax=Hyphodiscus hymeniophilus TaxID=353542 RepID=A0A9P6VK78_9HELO|nr:Regulation of enolase 1 [Hyphodiscus hymeniophilus]
MASHLAFKFANSKETPPSPSSTTFQLTTQASTDIWRKPGPPEIQTFNAPILYKSLPLSVFQRARVTVSAPWSTLYDQGGLVFILPESSDGSRKWIKSGIEFYQGEAYVSTVAADRWADWSLVQTGLRGGREVTLEFERSPEEGTLWIYVVDGEKKIPVREVTWILSEGDEKECWVGVYAAKPTESSKGTEPELVVDFKGWELDVV